VGFTCNVPNISVETNLKIYEAILKAISTVVALEKQNKILTCVERFWGMLSTLLSFFSSAKLTGKQFIKQQIWEHVI